MSDRAHEHEGDEARRIRDRQVAEILQELRVAPTTHRIRFHQRDRAFLVAYANGAAIAGLACLLVAMLAAVLLVTDFVFGRTTAVLATSGVGLVLVTLWFAVPLARYRRD